MSEYISRAAALRRTLDLLLSENVRPFLKSRGFAKSGRTFRRSRGPLYDMINFQGNKWNGVAPQHGFFVNVGVGSAEIDAVYLGWRNDRKPTHDYVIDTRWERLVPGTPSEVTFDETTDLEQIADMICVSLGRVLTVIDAIDTSASLAQWVVSQNWVHRMEKTCSYLASVGDAEALTRYVGSLRARFHDDKRWPLFNRKLLDVTGPMAPKLTEQGLLDGASPVDMRNAIPDSTRGGRSP